MHFHHRNRQNWFKEKKYKWIFNTTHVYFHENKHTSPKDNTPIPHSVIIIIHFSIKSFNFFFWVHTHLHLKKCDQSIHSILQPVSSSKIISCLSFHVSNHTSITLLFITIQCSLVWIYYNLLLKIICNWQFRQWSTAIIDRSSGIRETNLQTPDPLLAFWYLVQILTSAAKES